MRKLLTTIGILGTLALFSGCSLHHFSTDVYFEDDYSECDYRRRYDDHHWRHRSYGRYDVGRSCQRRY